MAERPTFNELFSECKRSAVHLEIRDVYTPDDSAYVAWKAGVQIDPIESFREWYDLIVDTVSRGVEVRRARVVSEPITDFIRHEYEVTSRMNIPAGERVRWLPRWRALDLALPANDFWVFDDRVVRFGNFAGDGSYLGHQITERSNIVKMCVEAFEAVWERATDHSDYWPD
ncbi:DUF6879 family protein [Actinomadura sp. DC4]|uniref:DUF6879 family protein n=1 Tax=Actinomadura sp. DC4 TaxID=3055069 RepID=UPI0025B1D8A1|nr:DUF6879 family protein [Actinomadura sp. DC4]MDN3351942.1 hypothetical protein [Actinomadura sp. DC4]